MTPFLFALAGAVVGAILTWLLLRLSTRGSAESAGIEEPPRQPGGQELWVSVADNQRYVERALCDLRLGVIIFGPDKTEVYRNNVAQQFATGRHGNAIVAAALERVVEGAFLGLSLEESVDLYGPPSRNLLVQASPTFESGEVIGSVAVIDNVTETRHLDRVRSDFVANVSHELRTPIGAMSVLAETMQNAKNEADRSRLGNRMVREAKRLSETIDDLLSLSRLESGPVSEPVEMDLASVLVMAIDRTAERASQRSVAIEVTDDQGGPVMVSGDQAQLVSAVSNLCENAIKYSDVGATVNLSIEVDSNDQAVLTVADAGPGIPARDLSRVFERFYRVDSARSRATGGTGLGLSIVRNVVTNHHGTVEVESKEGEGSTFTVRLPLHGAANTSDENGAP